MEDTTLSTTPEEDATLAAQDSGPQAEDQAAGAVAPDAELESLDDLDDVDFDLDEVENKIAPLALAATEPARW
ncbi:ammosamide/lymphostin RiPP family protein [Streptomyces sp. NPDC054841]